MLKKIKLSLLRTARAVGLESAVRDSEWRRQRLVILCYHSISLRDEHAWNQPLYMRPDDFEARLKQLKRGSWNVLPLDEAVRRMYAGDLPERSVVITFDDGTHDVYQQALPRLQAYGFPATVYLTTYYCEQNLPVFPPTCSYILWSSRQRTLDMKPLTGEDVTLSLGDPDERQRAIFSLLNFASDRGMGGEEKHELLQRLSNALGFDFDGLCRDRLLHIMTPEEVAKGSRSGLAMELHTHRHRTPLDGELFRREIRENREKILAMTGRAPEHFCYPSGVHKPEFIQWLAEENVLSATVCESGIASAANDRWMLPRVVDHAGLTSLEFESWLSGSVSLLPHRRIFINEVDRSGRAVLPRTSPAT